MKAVVIILLLVAVMAYCDEVRVVDYNPIGDQLYNGDPGNFGSGGYEQISTGPTYVDGNPQQQPYPHKKYDNPLLRGGK